MSENKTLVDVCEDRRYHMIPKEKEKEVMTCSDCQLRFNKDYAIRNRLVYQIEMPSKQ